MCAAHDTPGIDLRRVVETIRQTMSLLRRALFLMFALAPLAHSAPPPALATALEFLRDQKSYSWETINSDPGPVAVQLETRRGTVTTVQQNMAPNTKGQVDRNGDTLLRREWSDGLRLDTIITKDGVSVTNTPEGWMTEKEILTAQADENLKGQGATPRYVWLRRADRPDVRRPDQELTPFLKSTGLFQGDGSSYTASLRLNSNGETTAGEDGEPATNVTITMNLRGGNIRDYEIKIEGTRRATRARIAVPINEQRIVIITYVPVSRIDIPSEARDKLQLARLPQNIVK
jgi:hypothetical protein